MFSAAVVSAVEPRASSPALAWRTFQGLFRGSIPSRSGRITDALRAYGVFDPKAPSIPAGGALSSPRPGGDGRPADPLEVATLRRLHTLERSLSGQMASSAAHELLLDEGLAGTLPAAPSLRRADSSPRPSDPSEAAAARARAAGNTLHATSNRQVSADTGERETPASASGRAGRRRRQRRFSTSDISWDVANRGVSSPTLVKTASMGFKGAADAGARGGMGGVFPLQPSLSLSATGAFEAGLASPVNVASPLSVGEDGSRGGRKKRGGRPAVARSSSLRQTTFLNLRNLWRALGSRQEATALLVTLFGRDARRGSVASVISDVDSNNGADDKGRWHISMSQSWKDWKFVIHPFSAFRSSWDAFTMVLIAYTVVTLPYLVAFQFSEWDVGEAMSGGGGDDEDLGINWNGWTAMDLFVDIVFLFDVVLNFFTGFVDERDEVVVLDRKQIARRYAKTWFALDLVSAVPLDLMVVGSRSGVWRLPRTLKLLRFTRLVRLLRFSRIFRYLSRLGQRRSLQISPFGMRVVKLALTAMLFTHWNACVQFLVSAAQDFPDDSWVSRLGLVDAAPGTQYSWALFNSLSHMLCIGYGFFPPGNVGEVWATNISMLTGASMYASFIGLAASLLMDSDSGDARYAAQLDAINLYMANRRLPLALRDRVRDNLAYRWRTRRLLDEHDALDSLPASLRTDVALHAHGALLRTVPLFVDAQVGFAVAVAVRLQPGVMLMGEVLVRQGDVADEMMFITSGEVLVELMLASGVTEAVSYLGAGSHIGEIALLWNVRRTASVAVTSPTVEVAILNHDHFARIFEVYDAEREALARIAGLRVQHLDQMRESYDGSPSSAEGANVVAAGARDGIQDSGSSGGTGEDVGAGASDTVGPRGIQVGLSASNGSADDLPVPDAVEAAAAAAVGSGSGSSALMRKLDALNAYEEQRSALVEGDSAEGASASGSSATSQGRRRAGSRARGMSLLGPVPQVSTVATMGTAEHAARLEAEEEAADVEIFVPEAADHQAVEKEPRAGEKLEGDR